MKYALCLAFLLVLTLSTRFNWLSPLAHNPAKDAKKYDLSMFYCGFGNDFCGQSTDDDVNRMANNVILAFVNTNVDGSVVLD